MSEPYIVGETLHKAFWTRMGLRTLTGQVLLANAECFYVKWEGGSESLTQKADAGWKRTMDAALGHALDALERNLRCTENDCLRIRGQIQSTKTLLAHAGQLEKGATT